MATFKDLKENLMDTTQKATGAVKSALTNEEHQSSFSDGYLSTHSALKIIYYLMALDGGISPEEETLFREIGTALDKNFQFTSRVIEKDCVYQLEKANSSEDYRSVILEGVDNAIASSVPTEDSFITPKLLIWDLLTVSYSDEQYSEPERDLIKAIAQKLDVDEATLLELESSLQTLTAIDKETTWIKTTSKPYIEIEAIVNELADRKNAVTESVNDLLTL